MDARVVRTAGRRFVGPRAAVALTGLVALLSVATGVVTIGATAVRGPLSPLVPAVVSELAGFTGALTGFLLLVSAYGLRQGLRAAWYATLVLLPVAALQGLAQASPYSYPLVVGAVLALAVLALNRRPFDRRLSLTATQLAALAAIVGAQAYGTIGAYALREDFAGIETAMDAFYYTLVTASTVGYGDAAPVTQSARLFAMSVVVIGAASFAAALGVLLTPAIEARLARALGTMNDSQLDLLDDHVIVVGVGDLTAPIVEELADEGHPFVVIADDPERARRLRDRGFEVVVADPSDDEPLRRVGVERARALVTTTDDDAADALVILTARELNRDLTIVSSATERDNVKKLRRAGADAVLSPAAIGGHLMVQSALGDDDAEAVADSIVADEIRPADE